jgi:P27 family predicted phage terminase small subunit
MRGRKPKPTIVRALGGNAGRRPLNTDEPQPPILATTDDPIELADQPDALTEWRRLAPMLRAVKQITDADRGALLAACIEWSTYLDARRHATKRVIAGKVNPWHRVQRDALHALLKLWPELGLTPSARTRVKVAETPLPGGDDFSEFDDSTATH